MASRKALWMFIPMGLRCPLPGRVIVRITAVQRPTMQGDGAALTCQLSPLSPLLLLLLWLPLLWPLEEPLPAGAMVLLLARALLLRRCRVRRRLLKRSPTSSFLFMSSFSLRRCSLPTASASTSSSSSRTCIMLKGFEECECHGTWACSGVLYTTSPGQGLPRRAYLERTLPTMLTRTPGRCMCHSIVLVHTVMLVR